MQEKSPMLRLWELGEQYHGGLIRAVLSASVGVLCGILPILQRHRSSSDSSVTNRTLLIICSGAVWHWEATSCGQFFMRSHSLCHTKRPLLF